MWDRLYNDVTMIRKSRTYVGVTSVRMHSPFFRTRNRGIETLSNMPLLGPVDNLSSPV